MSERTSYTPGTARGFWYVRDTGERHPKTDRRIYEVAHGSRADVIRLTDPCDVGRAARVANSMNRIDGNTHAPRFNESTGEPTA